MPEIVLKGVTKRFGRITAIENIDFSIKNGEYVTVLGPSGCGKTTIIKMIAGIWEPTEGHITIDGVDMSGWSISDRDIGYVFQNIALFPHMSIWENATYGPRVKVWPKEEGEKKAREALELVNILDKKGFFPSELSGGEQQKSALARALTTGSKLLLLDEPISALDARVRVELRYDLRRLVKDLGLTAIHVTHDQEEAMSISDRIILMKKGEIVEISEPEELYHRPKSIFAANFIGETNFLRGRIKKTGTQGLISLENHVKITADTKDLNHGVSVIVATRPEYLDVLPLDKKKADSDLAFVEGSLDKIVFLGAYYRYFVDLVTGERVTIDVPSDKEKSINIGEPCMVQFDSEQVMLFEIPPKGLEEVLKIE